MDLEVSATPFVIHPSLLPSLSRSSLELQKWSEKHTEPSSPGRPGAASLHLFVICGVNEQHLWHHVAPVI